LEDSIGISIVVNVAAKVGVGIGQRRNGDNDCDCDKLHDCALILMVEWGKTNGKSEVVATPIGVEGRAPCCVELDTYFVLVE
jgi:hypothetical protein